MQRTTPRYQEVAADFAAKIVEGNYKQGERIYARSALASQYGVSAETARRAICVLSDLGVVEAVKGSGVTILSVEKAVEFLEHYNEASSIMALKEELHESISKQKEELDRFAAAIDELPEKAERYRAAHLFAPYKVPVDNRCTKLGKNLAETNFWHHTGATVIAIMQGDELIISPGPYAVLTEGSILYYYGEQKCVERVHSFLTK
jgi:K+/H+ antiporter YhaU regulatory subunit KhtT